MKEEAVAFGLGVVLGLIVLLGIDKTFDGYANQAQKAIAECEKNLPRTQHCVVSAKPEAAK